MDDERVVGAELERLAANDPLDPIDPQAMLTRGRRSRRTRRLLAGSGGIAAVAVIALGASALAGPTTATPQPDVASPQTTTSTTADPDFTAVPGVPRGEDGAGAKLALAEVNRRCSLRNPDVDRPVRPAAPNLQSGTTVQYDLQKGDHAANCTIPGGDRPSAALVAAARKDPVPKTVADQLRNCSVHFWTDLRNWKVLTSDLQPGLASALVAKSPSGKSIVTCILEVTPYEGPQLSPDSRIIRTASTGRNTFSEVFTTIPGGQRGCSPTTHDKCTGWLYTQTGRMPSNVARVRIEPIAGGRHDITVNDGWFAVAWLSSDSQARPDAKATAYDKDGQVLQVLGG
ncbi:hypothetical protein GCM10029976_056420 [Kribbella albertanoniae]|uniref:Uncharacterized protein n=1 Tax=Kribbella albertanoniae TaxID=1266829 RepID=A0A4R4PR44_9ACTN|nr:hypothetical protein [Kribbella albertanoniae]TDC24583.1 hypothetical protein E1261_25940 [Kribbella albertanoniae]